MLNAVLDQILKLFHLDLHDNLVYFSVEACGAAGNNVAY